MAEAKDENIEGLDAGLGDESDFNYDATEKKLAGEPTDSRDVMNEETGEITKDISELNIPGLDTEPEIEMGTSEVDLTEETEETETEPAEETPAVTGTGEKVTPPSEEDQAVSEIVKYLKDGEVTTLKIKGEERNIADLSPQEIRKYLNMGGRFYQKMDELATREKELSRKEQYLDQGVRQLSQLRQPQAQPQTQQPQVPDALKESEFDTEEVRGLKGVVANLQTRLNQMQQSNYDQSVSIEQQRLLQEMDNLKEEYPLASKEEVIAMKAIRPDISTAEMMEVSHNRYSGDAYFDAVLQSRPEKMREIKEVAIKEYLAKKGKATKMGRSSTSSTTSKKTSPGKKPKIRSFEDIEAHKEDLKREVERLMDEGEEL